MVTVCRTCDRRLVRNGEIKLNIVYIGVIEINLSLDMLYVHIKTRVKLVQIHWNVDRVTYSKKKHIKNS